MMKTRPRTAASGTVSIHSSKPLKELLEDSSRVELERDQKIKRKAQRSKSAGCVSSHDLSQQRKLMHLSSNMAPDVKSWLSERSAQIIQEKTEFESSSVRNLYNSLLENENELTEEVADYISENTELHRRKKFLLLKDWTEQVYDPLKAEIDREMSSKNYKYFERTKRQLYTEYLNYNNQKGNVFLDTISCDDYDPLCLNGHRPGPLKVKLKKPKDPLLHQMNKQNDEEKTVIACETGLHLKDREIEHSRLPVLPLVPLGRHGTKCKTWLRMELHDIHSDVRQRSQRRMLGIRTNSSIDFEAWNQRDKEPFIVEKEQNLLKRRQFKEKHHTAILLT